jgi:hypothetical protein
LILTSEFRLYIRGEALPLPLPARLPRAFGGVGDAILRVLNWWDSYRYRRYWKRWAFSSSLAPRRRYIVGGEKSTAHREGLWIFCIPLVSGDRNHTAGTCATCRDVGRSSLERQQLYRVSGGCCVIERSPG